MGLEELQITLLDVSSRMGRGGDKEEERRLFLRAIKLNELIKLNQPREVSNVTNPVVAVASILATPTIGRRHVNGGPYITDPRVFALLTQESKSSSMDTQ